MASVMQLQGFGWHNLISGDKVSVPDTSPVITFDFKLARNVCGPDFFIALESVKFEKTGANASGCAC